MSPRALKLPTLLAGASCAAALLAPSVSASYVRTLTCTLDGGQYACKPGEEPKPVFWPHRGIRFSANERGTPDIELAPDGQLDGMLAQTIATSFEAWNAPTCSNLLLVDQGTTAVAQAGYDRDREDNVNVIVWLESWPYTSTTAYAITSVTFDPQSAKISDADIELNGEFFTFGTADGTGGGDIVDIGNTLTHEVGHFIGLDHTPVPGATMVDSAPIGEVSKRDLHPDDIEGLCAIYPDDGQEPRFEEPPEVIDITGATCISSVARPRRAPRHRRDHALIAALLAATFYFSRRRSRCAR